MITSLIIFYLVLCYTVTIPDLCQCTLSGTLNKDKTLAGIMVPAIIPIMIYRKWGCLSRSIKRNVMLFLCFLLLICNQVQVNNMQDTIIEQHQELLALKEQLNSVNKNIALTAYVIKE